MMRDTSAYRARARKVFSEFETAMRNPNDGSTTIEDSFWRFGCSFDTMTDYLLLLKKSSEQADIEVYNDYKTWLSGQLSDPSNWESRVDPYAQYLKTMVKFGHACCYDDFCWWGIASAKALPESPYYELFLDLFGKDGVADFQKAATLIWGVVNNGDYDTFAQSIPASYPGRDQFLVNYSKRKEYHGGSRLVWDRVTKDQPKGVKEHYNGDRSLEPRYTGGMWQYDYYWDPINKTASFEEGAAHEGCAQNGDPADINSFRIGPFQNTLMSNLVIVYASRLHTWGATANQSEYLPVAGEVSKFLNNWFTLKGESGDTSDDQLLWHYNGATDESKVLVRERVGSYKNGKVPGYWVSDEFPSTKPDRPTNRVWTGDQGLLLGGLVNYELASGQPRKVNELITSLIEGTLDTGGPLFFPTNSVSGGGLQHFDPWEDWGDHARLFCLRDYWSGAGVFWRYLLQTYQSNETVKKVIGDILSRENNAIIQSVEAAMSDPTMPQNKPGILVDEVGALFKWFSPMATLTAVIHIIEDQA